MQPRSLTRGSQWVSGLGSLPPRRTVLSGKLLSLSPLHKPSGEVPGLRASCCGLLAWSGGRWPGPEWGAPWMGWGEKALRWDWGSLLLPHD